MSTTFGDQSLTIVCPSNGEDVGTVRSAGPAEVAAAVAAARHAQESWAQTSAQEGGRYLHAMADALEREKERLADLNHRETGKTLEDSRGGVDAGISTLRQYAELGPLHRGHSLRGELYAADYTMTRPRGVAVALTPWNDPVAVAMGLIGAALVTGNTVIHKPSERNPHLGIYLGEVLSAVLPADVHITLTGGPQVGVELTRSAIDVIAHVGSTATGKAIALEAARTGAHVIRENGGNDPLIVDRDVDPPWAAGQAALGCFANAGQICTSVERIYVHHDVAEPFIDALVTEATRLNSSPGQPLVDVSHRDHVHGHVAAAISAGARALTGAEIPTGPGAHYPATVLVQCEEDMAVMAEETFGPVAAITVVDSFEEGLALGAAGRYGLAATVLTTRIEHALQSAARLHVGTLKINGVFGGAPGGSAQPHAESGQGFGYGPELLDEMTLTSVVHIEAGRS